MQLPESLRGDLGAGPAHGRGSRGPRPGRRNARGAAALPELVEADHEHHHEERAGGAVAGAVVVGAVHEGLGHGRAQPPSLLPVVAEGQGARCLLEHQAAEPEAPAVDDEVGEMAPDRRPVSARAGLCPGNSESAGKRGGPGRDGGGPRETLARHD